MLLLLLLLLQLLLLQLLLLLLLLLQLLLLLLLVEGHVQLLLLLLGLAHGGGGAMSRRRRRHGQDQGKVVFCASPDLQRGDPGMGVAVRQSGECPEPAAEIPCAFRTARQLTILSRDLAVLFGRRCAAIGAGL